MDLNLVQIIFDLETDDTAAIAALCYQKMRSFDQFFRQSCCRHESKACLECVEQPVCPYPDVFAQKLSADPDVVRRHQKPPLPFAFKIRQMLCNNSSLELGIVVVGSAINHLPVFVDAVRCFIKSTREQCPGTASEITGTYCIDYQSIRHELDISFQGTQNLVVLSSLEIMENTTVAENIRLILESPMRLLSAGSVLHTMDFGVFLRSQLRRCSSLFAHYGDGELDIDYAGISISANRARCLNDGIRYAQPSWSQRLNQAGLAGISVFTEIAPGMLALLKLGSYFNAGKGASFGLGAYRTESI